MRTKREFIREWMQTTAEEGASKSLTAQIGGKKFSGVPKFHIFVDMDYFALLSPVSWTPEAYRRKAIFVPRGFVTDFASVPRLFWSLFPPIGRYGFAALFHDYVYWEQALTRYEADFVFRDTMKELQVPAWKTMVLFGAVRLFGFVAWRGNAALKAKGEKRVLKAFPSQITIGWRQWKQEPDVFV
ncbi:DUF1353 domain-containing protein [Bradyrhizobium sp. 169]|uniref:DUF1353 domain-containing protein n=1 Tax=Bradyrhizobium sp. 169 TaxID=2782640 RepID=UPI001FF7CFE7|nr:DUF1353 domain-containing protein [Bradyrhizobium sp. 169]MCK1586915.1 DUF1353 domain-containing protein [Bradyrhizobium sp. 169]